MQVQRFLNILAVLLLFWSGASRAQVQAQSGYNYVRPELATATVSGAAGARLAAGAALLPGAYPTANIALTPAPATTAYGAGLLPSPAVGYTPSGQATTAFGAPASNIGALQQPRRPGATATTITGRGSPYAQPQFNTAPAPSGRASSAGLSGSGNDNDYNDGDYSAIPGVPGVDYPVYAQVPRTNFDCIQQPLPGYYADIEAQCQVFHICALNRTYSFLCPNGTVFSQETLVCVWWNQYDCISAPNLYANNAYIYDYSGSSSNNASPNNNLNANAYQLGTRTAPTTAYGATTGSASAAALRPNVVQQVSGYVGSNAARAYSTPSPTAAQPQAQYGAVLRPGQISANLGGPGTGRSVATSAPSLLNAAATLPDNAVGSFAQPVATGNREYLPPATIGRRQRATAA